MELLITLKIVDPETVEAYKDIADILILEDIVHGSLGDMLGMVSVEYKEA